MDVFLSMVIIFSLYFSNPQKVERHPMFLLLDQVLKKKTKTIKI